MGNIPILSWVAFLWICTLGLLTTLPVNKEEEDKPAFYVYNAVTQEKIPIKGSIYLLATKVSFLKTLITLKCGFPNSVYCLRTQEGREIYDCNTLNDYQLDIGTTLRLDVWDGWKEFLTGCLLGSKHMVQRFLSDEEPVLRYQKRVALYLAAFFGHLELAAWILKQGVKPNEAVGVHPYREWCQETHHPDVTKCPVHAAAEAGQLMILKAFVNHSVLCIECQNSAGQSPLNICIKHQHKDCVLYLVTKMWSVVSYPNFSLPMKIYIKLKQWLLRAQSRILTMKWLNQTAVFRTRVGDTVIVDGFTQPKMTSKARIKAAGNKDYRLPNLTDQTLQEKDSCPLTVTKWNQKVMKLKLPPLEHTNRLSNINRLDQRKTTRKKVARHIKDESMDQNMCLTKVPLPPISSRNSLPPFCYSTPNAKLLINSSCESFSEHCGRTPRDNAIYCLAVARYACAWHTKAEKILLTLLGGMILPRDLTLSCIRAVVSQSQLLQHSAFKEKPWLQQLGIARTLAKKYVCKPGLISY